MGREGKPMFAFVLTLLLLLIISSLFAVSFSSGAASDVLFEQWRARHNKTYATDAETLLRRKIFEENAAFVAAHNSAGEASYQLELNAFADLTPTEFRNSRFGGLAAPPVELRQVVSEFRGVEGSVPEKIDWREKGAVTGVKDQGSCGACWSFSATGAIEGINKIVTGSLVSLSEQELIDCDRSYNQGCNGGLMDYAYKWVVQNHGIDSENDYPFQTSDGTCKKNKLTHRVVTIDGYSDVPANSEKLLLQAVATQPVSVGICGSERTFQLYSKGIFTGPCSTTLDHAVLIVGYGSENGKDYWIVKNSWGPSWGMEGYVHILRNSGDLKGVCGINMMASFPKKTTPNPPPPPSPGPTKCGIITSCPEGNTCCCSLRIFGVCLSWKCCPLESAVCCSDKRSCCPHDYPICDTDRGLCLKGNGNATSLAGIKRTSSFFHIPTTNNFFSLWDL